MIECCWACKHSVDFGEDYLYCAMKEGNVQHEDPVCDWYDEVEEMTMDRNGVNEYIDDDYSNSTCDCYWCKQREQLRKVLITEQDGDDISFDLVWVDKQKEEPPERHMCCECEECTCDEPHFCDDACDCADYEDEMLDIADELQAAEFCEILADDTENAMADVLIAFEEGAPRDETLRKINELQDLLQAMEYIVASE